MVQSDGAEVAPLKAGGPISRASSFQVSLHDAERRDEVELTVRLIAAVNESDRVCTSRGVDEILGLPRSGR